ncbi:MAG: hypothetical protein K1564_20010 [Candidatus Thiodiazotropha sp. (ex. Lucinisca nassula)]|nr:hypothetical protein [Candidatus Thiodiazotropha sp. (ex. Lucinisca nassula)]
MKMLASALALLLIGSIAYTWLGWPERHQQALSVTAAEGKQNQPGLESDGGPVLKQQAQQYRLIAQRTLFRSDRQGFEAQVSETPNQRSRPSVPKVRLLGVILTQGEPASAMIMEEKSKKSRLLKLGDELGQWKIQDIASDHLLLSWENQEHKIQLRKF